MPGILIGELAALTTALCWSITPILFTLAGRVIGPMNVNRARLLIALVFVIITHVILFGTPLPPSASLAIYAWLIASGIIGLTLGDSLMYISFHDIGPRKTILIMATTPIFSAILAWIFLGEILSISQISGILITVSGVVWVISKQSENSNGVENPEHYTRGIFLSLGAAICQAIGLILAKQGMSEEFSPVSVALVRMIAATAVLWGWVIVKGKGWSTIRSISQRSCIIKLLTGSFLGPFAGITLSMVAIYFAPVGIASTIMMTSPLLLIPLSRKFLGDDAGFSGLAGTIIALIGISVLLLW